MTVSSGTSAAAPAAGRGMPDFTDIPNDVEKIKAFILGPADSIRPAATRESWRVINGPRCAASKRQGSKRRWCCTASRPEQ